eukprot:Gb_25456 [translate_table: standard]
MCRRILPRIKKLIGLTTRCSHHLNTFHGSPCHWRGISCDNFTNAVTKINLTNTFITEVDFYHLLASKSHHINIAGEQFFGTLPRRTVELQAFADA